MKVVRNTLARRAFEGTGFECVTDTLVGPSLIAFSNEHPGAGGNHRASRPESRTL